MVIRRSCYDFFFDGDCAGSNLAGTDVQVRGSFFRFSSNKGLLLPSVLHSRGTLGLDRVRSKEFFFWNSFFLLFFSPGEKMTQGPPQQHRVLSRTRRFNLLEDKPVTFLKTSCHEVCVGWVSVGFLSRLLKVCRRVRSGLRRWSIMIMPPLKKKKHVCMTYIYSI